ncbi:PREDICTED: uncharacterized protein LOC104598621 [Nelumbo nucifera]|uniref:Uncharacterized protein LOC104598621 n=2 Tax=Nelumbo nucifera TaxID=4432 RepID=A0A1U8A2R7_NELNU|nr:PREDICTED: uncharacterized protein LOC104598621 [Nelumbo nucifera]DAD47893.1 TPA_asm: hypothetical protein HUJ06_017830 [Nelumbo nucifera]
MEGASFKPEGGEGKEELSDISLRPLVLADVDDLMVWVTDDQVARFCRWDTYTSREDALNYMRDVAILHPWLRAICLKNRPIGSISVTSGFGNEKCRGELSYALASEHWGRGLATQAVKMVVSSVFHDFPYLERLEALVDSENLRSQRVLEKVGFTREGFLRKYLIVKGSSRDIVMYSLLSADLKS